MLSRYKDDCVDEMCMFDSVTVFFLKDGKAEVGEKTRIQTGLGVMIFFRFCLR